MLPVACESSCCNMIFHRRWLTVSHWLLSLWGSSPPPSSCSRCLTSTSPEHERSYDLTRLPKLLEVRREHPGQVAYPSRCPIMRPTSPTDGAGLHPTWR